jgi:hypothetical protein
LDCSWPNLLPLAAPDQQQEAQNSNQKAQTRKLRPAARKIRKTQNSPKPKIQKPEGHNFENFVKMHVFCMQKFQKIAGFSVVQASGPEVTKRAQNSNHETQNSNQKAHITKKRHKASVDSNI